MSNKNNFINEYNARRHLNNGGLVSATVALAATRRAFDMDRGRAFSTGRANPWRPIGAVNPPMNDGRRWIENADACGLRFVNYAHEIAGFDHRGWYCDDDCMGSVVRGAVYQLPARNGRALYVPAMLDPENDGAFLADFSRGAIEYGEPGGDETDSGFTPDAAVSCAHLADSMAENYAEREREHNAASRDGMDYADKGDELRALRDRARAQVAAIRSNAGTDIVGLLSDTFCDIWEDIEILREKRAELRERYEHASGFNVENRAMLEMFNEHAGLA